jgi:hypothetical protein
MSDNGSNFILGLIIGLMIGVLVGGFTWKAAAYKEGQIDCIEGKINFKPINKINYIWKD